jgi:hypothetical protein
MSMFINLGLSFLFIAIFEDEYTQETKYFHKFANSTNIFFAKLCMDHSLSLNEHQVKHVKILTGLKQK